MRENPGNGEKTHETGGKGHQTGETGMAFKQKDPRCTHVVRNFRREAPAVAPNISLRTRNKKALPRKGDINHND